ncbi:transcriptional regulator [Halorussus gelatinilyticus]|uniref:Transcriptional regulator n=2 Tax=Halorussus TaxID=1070314 RepID=A0A8U0IFQ5_9EURY|nr:transcriptional regulator [Halorussus gelatinilyticus]UPV99916.1 transcriptional regulator [Halorussus gelatinilyticus]
MFDELWNIYRYRLLLAVSDHTPRTEDEFTPESLASDEPDDDDLDGVKTELQNTHLPKLAEHGYIEWDAETQTIWRGPNFEEIAPLLRPVDDHRDELPKGWL